MTDSAQPFAAKKFLEIKGRRMAYIDEGEGAPVALHLNRRLCSQAVHDLNAVIVVLKSWTTALNS